MEFLASVPSVSSCLKPDGGDNGQLPAAAEAELILRDLSLRSLCFLLFKSSVTSC